MDSIPKWFEGIYINIAENLLHSRSKDNFAAKRGTKGKEDSKIAVTQIREGNTEVQDFTWAQLRSGVGELASAMRAHGVKTGDRIAIVASNSFDTLEVFLATTALGGMFSSSSTDMGVKGILDRLVQIEPKVGIAWELYIANANNDCSIYLWTTTQYTMVKQSTFDLRWYKLSME